MPTTPAAQVLATSIDTAGVSIATGSPTADTPRMGMIYDALTYAAAAPIWFHTLRRGHYLMVAGRFWHDATPDGGIPGGYTAYTEDTTPSWVLIDGPTAARFPIPGYALYPPMRTSVTSAMLTAATSRPPNYLYLLNKVVIAGQDQAVLQCVYTSVTDSVQINAEEVLPTVTVGEETVVFCQGIQYAHPYFLVYGTDSSGNLYRLRKLWSQVGANKPDPAIGNPTVPPRGWEFFAGWGYSYDASEIAPVQSGLTSAGPVSFALYRNAAIMSTVHQDGDVRTGQIWMSQAGRTWERRATGIPLGSVADGSYLGHGLRLMGQLGADAAAVGTASAGVPYVTTIKSEESGVSRLLNTWDVWKVAL